MILCCLCELTTFMGAVGARVAMATGGKPLVGGLLARTGVLLVFGATGEAAWEHVVDLCCQSRSHVAPEFLLFPLVFLDQTALVGL